MSRARFHVFKSGLSSFPWQARDRVLDTGCCAQTQADACAWVASLVKHLATEELRDNRSDWQVAQIARNKARALQSWQGAAMLARLEGNQ